MAQLKRSIKITNNAGFYYQVVVEHSPNIGVSIAFHDDLRIASREYGRCCRPPTSDDDRDWEEYEEKLHELADEIETDLMTVCESHFNSLK